MRFRDMSMPGSSPVTCPLCGCAATLTPYAYADYETGYRDEGYRMDCSECGVFEACEVDRLLSQGKPEEIAS